MRRAGAQILKSDFDGEHTESSHRLHIDASVDRATIDEKRQALGVVSMSCYQIVATQARCPSQPRCLLSSFVTCYPDLRIVLILMKGTRFKQHKTSARFAILMLAGHVRLHHPSATVEVPRASCWRSTVMCSRCRGNSPKHIPANSCAARPEDEEMP